MFIENDKEKDIEINPEVKGERGFIEKLVTLLIRSKILAFGLLLIIYVCFFCSLSFLFWNAQIKEIINIRGSFKIIEESENSNNPIHQILFRAEISPSEITKFSKGKKVEVYIGEEIPPLTGEVIEVIYEKKGDNKISTPEIFISIQGPQEKIAKIKSQLVNPETERNIQVAVRTERLLFVIFSKEKLRGSISNPVSQFKQNNKK